MKSRIREDILVAVMILVPILAVAIPAFIIHAAPEHGRKNMIAGETSFDTSELTADGVSYRKTFDFDYDGLVDHVRVYKSGASCTSIEFWLQEIDDTVDNAKADAAIILDNEGENQTDAYVVWQPHGGPMMFRSRVSESGSIVSKLAVTAKATGGACNVTFKVFGKSYVQ